MHEQQVHFLYTEYSIHSFLIDASMCYLFHSHRLCVIDALELCTFICCCCRHIYIHTERERESERSRVVWCGVKRHWVACVTEMTCMLETRRLRLRQIREKDAGPIAACLGKDDRVARMTSRIPWPYSRSDADAFVTMTMRTEEKEYVWAVETKSDSRFIGVVGLQYNHHYHHDNSDKRENIVTQETTTRSAMSWDIGLIRPIGAEDLQRKLLRLLWTMDASRNSCPSWRMFSATILDHVVFWTSWDSSA